MSLPSGTHRDNRSRKDPMPEDPISDIITELDSIGWRFETLLISKRGQWKAIARHTITQQQCVGVARDYRAALKDLYRCATDQVGSVTPKKFNRKILLTQASPPIKEPRYVPTPKELSARSAAIHAADQASLAQKLAAPPAKVRKSGRTPTPNRVWKAPIRPAGRTRSEIAVLLGVSRRRVDAVAIRLGIVSDVLSDDQARQIIVDIQ